MAALPARRAGCVERGGGLKQNPLYSSRVEGVLSRGNFVENASVVCRGSRRRGFHQGGCGALVAARKSIYGRDQQVMPFCQAVIREAGSQPGVERGAVLRRGVPEQAVIAAQQVSQAVGCGCIRALP